MREDDPTTAAAMEAALAAVRAAVAAAGVAIEILPDGEIALDELSRREP